METRPVVPDRKLLARLVLIREEARNMMGGGILVERNDHGLSTLPEPEVYFLTKLVALKPGKTVRERIKNVMQGKDEGAEESDDEEASKNGRRVSSRIAGRVEGLVLLGSNHCMCVQACFWRPKYIPHLWKSSRLDRYAILLSVALVWAYAAFLTAAGAYKNQSPTTQFSCRVDRSGLIGGASWLFVTKLSHTWKVIKNLCKLTTVICSLIFWSILDLVLV